MRKLPILTIFYISWVVFLIICSIWSVLMHIDIRGYSIAMYIREDLLKNVLISYGLSILVVIYFMIPTTVEEKDKKEEPKEDK